MNTENKQSEPQKPNSFRKILGAVLLFVAFSYAWQWCIGGDNKSTSNSSSAKAGKYFGERTCVECGKTIGAYEAGYDHAIGECFQPDATSSRGYFCSRTCCEESNSRTRFK